MSNIRIAGLLLAFLFAGFATIYFRGPRWNRLSFSLIWSFAIALFVVSADPDSIDSFRDTFNLGDFQYGRLLLILIISNILLFSFVIYTNTKVDSLKILIDRTLRISALNDVEGPRSAIPTDGIMVLIPALNEAENLKALLPQIPGNIRGLGVGVLVIDDGSTDNTKDIALEHGCVVVRSPVQRGQGAALRIGYSFLLKENIRVGVTMDADNQHRPNEIEVLVQPVIDRRYDLVIGSRILGTADRDSRTRYLGVIVFSRLVTWLTGVKITDCSSGFRAFVVEKMAQLDLRQDQFQTSEVLITAAKRGLRIGEVPIHIARRRHGESRKGRNFYYGLMFFKTVARTWWR
jgi:cellulose synthase/poly-beta-1,6-N-acetylglucosamine synthase-like glycosyltransferase